MYENLKKLFSTFAKYVSDKNMTVTLLTGREVTGSTTGCVVVKRSATLSRSDALRCGRATPDAAMQRRGESLSPLHLNIINI